MTVLAGLAEFERELIRARTGEGRQRAVAAGKKLGRRFKLSRFQMEEVAQRHAADEGVMDLARSYGVGHPTIIRALGEARA